MQEKILDEKELAKQLAYQQQLKEEISVAVLNNKANVILGNKVQAIIKPGEETDKSKEYDVVLEKTVIAKATKIAKNNKVNVQLNMKLIEEKMQNERRDNIKVQNNAKDSNALQKEIEQGLINGNAVEMEIDREVSTSENMRMFVKRAWGVSADKIYRVKGKDSHSFKYVAKTYDSKKPYQQIDLSHHYEGRNSNQKIWLMDNGVFKQKTVDSLLMKGNYGIATDIPESAMSDNTRTYLAVRTPSGEYIAIAAGQKSGVNRNTTGNMIEKDYMSRENSVYDLENIILSAKLAEQIYGFNKDGKLTVNEVEFVRRLKIDKNMDDKEIINAVDTIIALKEMGYERSEIKKILSAQNKNEIEKLAKGIDKKSKEDDSQKLPGGGIRTFGQENPHNQ